MRKRHVSNLHRKLIETCYSEYSFRLRMWVHTKMLYAQVCHHRVTILWQLFVCVYLYCIIPCGKCKVLQFIFVEEVIAFHS